MCAQSTTILTCARTYEGYRKRKAWVCGRYAVAASYHGEACFFFWSRGRWSWIENTKAEGAARAMVELLRVRPTTIARARRIIRPGRVR